MKQPEKRAEEIIKTTDHSSAAVASRRGKNADFSLVFSASKIRTTRGDIGRYGRQPRCDSMPRAA